MKYKIPLFKISNSKQDIKEVSKVISSGKGWAAGDSIIKFENEIKKFNKTKFAVSFNSGTSALIAMYIACNLKNKEIIVPSFSFISTASAVLISGAKLKFCDIESDTYGLNFTDLKKTITKKTKAVVLMHYSGCPARDTIKIKNLCNKNKIILLEDNAHSYGAKLNKKLTGTFGKASAMSFCQNKLISTGEGGAVVTNDKVIYEKLKRIRSHGRIESNKDDYFNSTKEFNYFDIGYNFRMPTMNAALGFSQLKYQYKNNIIKRIKIAKKFDQILSKCKHINLPKKFKNSDHFFQQYTIRINNGSSLLRNNLQKNLERAGIISRVYYEPIHLKTYFKKKYNKINLGNTKKISNTILTLPIYPDMKYNEINYIAKKIILFFKDKDVN